MQHVRSNELYTHSAVARHKRLFELIRQHGETQPNDRAIAVDYGDEDETKVVAPRFARQFIDKAERSLGRPAPDRRMAQALRRAI